MAKKEEWTLAQWAAYGNRVKRLHEELGSLLEVSYKVCSAKEIDVLLSVIAKVNKYKSSMERLAANTVTGGFVTKIFYGDILPEDTKS